MPSKIRKRGNSYLLTVTHEKKEYTKTVHVSTKKEAEKAWALFASEVIKDRLSARAEGDMTLDDFYIYWTRHYAEMNQAISSQGLNESIFQRISGALGHMKISKIRPRHILSFAKQLTLPDASNYGKPLSTAYIKKHMSNLRTMLSCAVQWGFIANNPMDNIRSPKGVTKKKVLPNEAELAAFFSAADNATTKHKLWIALAFTLGLRREEIFGLQWGDIDFDRRSLTVNRVAVYVSGRGIFVKDAKTDNSYRTIPINNFVLNLLYAWRGEVIAAEQNVISINTPIRPVDFLFPKADGSVGHPHAINTFMSRFCKKNNIPTISPHDLRHMYGSYLIAGGVNIATISSLLGHSDKSFTLKTYIHELKSLESHTADIMDSTMSQMKNITGK